MRRSPRAGCPSVVLLLALVALVVFVLALCTVPAGIRFLSSAGRAGRINLLVAGIDRQEGSDWAHRTDTIMIFTTDPTARTAGILSIPRDLQLPIPSYGEDRINTANVYGYLQGYPGGGPALLEATIEANFQIPIDGYVLLDFRTFEGIIDSLGGIDVDVPETLHDERYPDPRPDDPYAFKTVHFDAGPQHMNGQRALEYARSRMSTSDFDRARRQQQILLALRARILSFRSLPRWPLLVSVLSSGLKTDMSLPELIAFAGMAARSEPSSVKQVVLEAPLVYDYRRPDGAEVELPNWDLIDPVIEELFGPPGAR